ncbi:hypothetical protein V6N11_012280 [Hibiscus sabdariffa]|uniref:Uncharacterized protein n=1 Tax=Hibiscus sabdariffa TaxID=183260 RepID=A0ABR2QB45_9ROSI
MDVSSSLFTSTPVHVVHSLAKQTGNHYHLGQAYSIQQNSGQANSDHLESSSAFEVQIDGGCAQTEHSGSTSIERNGVYVEEGHDILNSFIEIVNSSHYQIFGSTIQRCQSTFNIA